MNQAKIILARYKKGIMSKSQVLNYLAVCGMDADKKQLVLNMMEFFYR